MKKICIISTRHVSYNPRVLKEADALFNAGYQVTVVTVNNHHQQREFDNIIMKDRKWKLKTVNFRKTEKLEKRKWFKLSIYNKIFKFLQKISLKGGIAERGLNKVFDDLKDLAIEQNADLYIAHHPETLAISYLAALNNNSKWGYDAEDFHSGMNELNANAEENKAISFLEAKYLPYAKYITSASKGIGEEYKKKYALSQKVQVILNVFPKENLKVTTNQPVKFYWYSQVIGPTRSLEQLIIAAGKLKGAFEIHLRGSFHNEAYKNSLQKLVSTSKVEDKIHFHEPILSEQLIENANQYDIGLALETDISINRNVCVTNKIFCYLMAGLAIIGTDTIGQKDIFLYFSNAVKQCKMNDIEELTKAMQYFIDHPDQMQLAKRAARQAAEQQFNWELESNKFIKTIEGIFENEKNINHFTTLPTI